MVAAARALATGDVDTHWAVMQTQKALLDKMSCIFVYIQLLQPYRQLWYPSVEAVEGV